MMSVMAVMDGSGAGSLVGHDLYRKPVTNFRHQALRRFYSIDNPVSFIDFIEQFAAMSHLCRVHASNSFSASAISLPSSPRGNR